MKTAVMLAAGLWAAWIGWMGETVAEEQDTMHTMPSALVLDPKPLAPDEVLATLDIVSKQGRLGGADDLVVREGQVTVGQPLLFELIEEPTVGTARLLAGSSDERWHFYLVVFRFTLHPPPGHRRYRQMDFKVALSDPRITAFQLLPERVVSEEDVTMASDLGFTISLSGGTLPLGGEVSANATRTVRFTHLRPVITAHGEGENKFYWRYEEPANNTPVDPGARRVAAVLQVPAGTERLSATILWDVNLERSIFEQWRNVPVIVNPLSVELPLPSH